MPVCTSIQTPLRRPCLLRAVLESNVDAPEGRRAALSPSNTTGVTTGGGNGPDHRTITMDMPARLHPRCSGLHRSGFGIPVDHAMPSKQHREGVHQAMGYDHICDMDLNVTRSPCSAPRRESQEMRRRTKIEELTGMPLSGKGADIDLVAGRRCEDLRSAHHSRERSPREAKTQLNGISISHQFQRRHFSAPPESRSREDFKHVVHAEGYANLLSRPEGTGKRTPKPTPPSSPVQRAPFRLEPRDLKGSLFHSSPYMRRAVSARELRCSYEEPGLREQTWLPRNRAVNYIEYVEASIEPSAAVLEATQNVRVEAASHPKHSRPRVGSPVKPQNRLEDSPRTPALNIRTAGNWASDHSLMSTSTAADADGFTPNTSSVLSSSPVSPVSSPTRRFRACRPSYVREEQKKARLRAAWVA